MNELQVSADLSRLPQVLAWIRTQVERTNLIESEQKRVELALEEAIVNVITHAAQGQHLDISLSCRHEPNRHIEFHLRDLGPPFNPLAHPRELQSEVSLEERQPGGLGLSIMRKYMDVLLYRREDNQNILTLIKNIRTQ